MRRLRRAALGALVIVFAAGLPQRSSVQSAAASRVSQAGASVLIGEVLSPRNRMEEDLRVLTDEIGGRVTGSAAYEAALKWGVEAFKKAGVDSAGLESYEAPARWEAESATASVISPYRFPLRITSFSLSPSTSGIVTARLVDAGAGHKADFEKLGAKAKGAVALVATKPMKSFEDLFGEYLMGPEMVEAARAAGVTAILFQSSRPRDLLYRHQVNLDGKLSAMPLAQIAREDGSRLARLLEKGRELTVSLEIRNKTGGPWKAQNVVAEIRGAQMPDEVVLLGAHLDSWDLGTGAQDNGVNCALVVDVARALAAGPRPRRTVRFVLFTNEETGLLGSWGYVRAHRGEIARHVAVIIHDIGDGRVKGYFTNGRPDIDAAVARALEPAASLGATGVDETAILGTDNFDFLLEGVPNLVADQETARYLPDYHAESDTFDKIDFDLARRNAAVAAIAVSSLANAASAPGPRQSRAEIERILADPRWRLDSQMKAYRIWDAWQSGERGRKP